MDSEHDVSVHAVPLTDLLAEWVHVLAVNERGAHQLKKPEEHECKEEVAEEHVHVIFESDALVVTRDGDDQERDQFEHIPGVEQSAILYDLVLFLEGGFIDDLIIHEEDVVRVLRLVVDELVAPNHFLVVPQ